MRTVRLTSFLYAIVVVVAVAFYAIATTFPSALTPGDIGPAVFPQSVAAFLVVLIAIEGLVARQTWRPVPLSDITIGFAAGAYISVAVILTGIVGIYIALPPALFGALWLLRERRVGLTLAYSLGFTFFLWAFFSYALDMPIGTFGG